MRIAAIDVFPIRAAVVKPFTASVVVSTFTHRSALLVRIRTDEGLEGWGETDGPVEMLAAGVKDVLEPVLLGKSPIATRTRWHEMHQVAQRLRHGLIPAVSALDMALWDLKGKIFGQPVAALLGASTAGRFPVVAAAVFYDPQQPEAAGPRADFAVRCAQRGFRGVKVKVGRLSPDEDLRHIATIRDAVGPGVMVAADANWCYTPRTAIYLAKKLADLGIYWFEEPLPLDDVAGYRAISQASEIRLAGGQELTSAEAFLPLLVARVLHLVQPRVSIVGGFTELDRVVTFARPFGARYSPPGWGTGVIIAAALQTRCATASPIGSPFPDLDWMEYDATDSPFKEVVPDVPIPKDGFLEIPPAPGLGIQVSLDAVRSLSVTVG